MNEYNDLSVQDLIVKMQELMKIGFVCYPKFTCSNCGSRQTSDTPNVLFTEGYSCEECRKISFPKQFGLMIMTALENKAGAGTQ